jgi:hypothetical protein
MRRVAIRRGGEDVDRPLATDHVEARARLVEEDVVGVAACS